MTDAPRELPIVGGNLALDFANTVDDPLGPTRHDHVATYPDLVRWSLRVDTLDEQRAEQLLRAAEHDPGAAEAALERAHELREVLGDVFGAVADGADDIAGRWSRLRPFAADAVAAAELDTRSGAYRWSWSGADDPAVVLHPVATAATDLLVSAELGRVKRCARCPWLYVDRSKNRSRRWCDMADCGTAEKMGRYVARRAARRRGA
ncbi:putative RNA-binding Zn ribbon-like protein [Pseudonocardia hierapolitana]|uniref:Putative RNA-binding Zn ribbon-like protein n=1 Tax=Pseudonocardia hierapolitana TaxID=1128676 RepID=A0A561SLV5_9PSEU|nr:ABATE domain-containing protein [Pseudonocardia hierapolitana]TWF75850.1 putative RNA-binding Zn ribbon-like protein [Pseudonocardia hierapolitana]